MKRDSKETIGAIREKHQYIFTRNNTFQPPYLGALPNLNTAFKCHFQSEIA